MKVNPLTLNGWSPRAQLLQIIMMALVIYYLSRSVTSVYANRLLKEPGITDAKTFLLQQSVLAANVRSLFSFFQAKLHSCEYTYVK